jgi:3'-5' exoribonuclease
MLSPSKNYKIKNVISDKTRENKIMKRFYLKDVETKEEFKCVIWEDILNSLEADAIKNGNIVQVLSSVYKEAFKTCTITKIQLVKKAPVGLPQEQRDEIFDTLLTYVNEFQNQKLKEATLQILMENKELLKISPAAEKMHHNYVGGLLLHIYECLQFATKILEAAYQNIDKELIIAACITHDLGKMFEYNVNVETGEVERNPEFAKSWISHIYYGFAWANNNGFPELAHIMASHHGRIEWGAMVEPATSEARLFHNIDDISAYAGRISADEIEDFEI